MYKSKYLIILLILISMNLVIKSQTIKLGIRYEPGILIIEKNGKGESLPAIFSMSGNAIVTPIDWIDIEIRPGLVFVGEDYSGFEFGLFSRFKILPTSLYLIAGINNHSNKGYNNNSGGSYDKNMLYKSIGIGYNFDPKFNIDVTYYWTSDKNFAYVKETDWLTYSKIIDKQMKGIIKIGLNLSWDVL